VGKSSLLRALTNSKPKIGNYEFTTLHPHVGVVDYEDFVQVSIADFPGILPDLSKGFGTKFFHHLDECKIFVFMVDLSREDAYEQFDTTRRALEFYNPRLLDNKPALIVASKIDLVEEDVAKRLADLKSKSENVYPVIPVSVDKKINLRKFLVVLRDAYFDFIDENKEK
jgi:GTP-binding protein